MRKSGAFTSAKDSAYKPAPNRSISVNRIGFSQRLELRQSQALVMTPQLQQAIKMLQLSNIELAEFVDSEIEQNPLLEHGERDSDEAPAASSEPEISAANGDYSGHAFRGDSGGARRRSRRRCRRSLARRRRRRGRRLVRSRRR